MLGAQRTTRLQGNPMMYDKDDINGSLIRGKRCISGLLDALRASNRGITGIETAIILIAFVLISSVLAYTLLSAGIFATEKSQDAVYRALEEVQSTTKIMGDVVAEDTDSDGYVDQVMFTIANALGGKSIDLSETTDSDSDGLLSDETTKNHSMIFNYLDQNLHINDITWTKRQVGRGNNDIMLDGDEKMLITVDLTATDNAVASNCAFSIIVVMPTGAELIIERVTPAVINTVTKLRHGGGIGGAGATTTTVAEGEYRKKITLESSKVAANLTDFPILINLVSDSDLVNRAQSDGDDIYFTSADGTTRLSHETEKYNDTTGELVAWVKIPSLSGGTDTETYMYYGDASTENQEDVANVWSNGYEAVYHLHQDFNDSTGDYNASNSGSVDLTGQVANGQDFTPANEIQAGNWSVGGSAITLQAWLNPDDFDQNDPRVISKANGENTDNHVFMLGLGGSGDRYVRGRIKTGTSDSSGTTTLESSTNPAVTGTWQVVSLTYDGSNMRLFNNGAVVGSTSKSGALRQNDWDITIGDNPDNTDTSTYSLDGKLDEVRVSSVARSQEWLTTEYNNQQYPDKAVHGANGFFTLGSEEESP